MIKYITIITSALMLLTTTSASAETKYNYKNEAHKVDMVCIAALSLGIDKTEGFDNTKFRKYTDIQNQYILKYSYSKQLNKHVKARKFLLEGYGNNFILNTIEECVKSIEPVTTTSASAETKYNYKNEAHKVDMVCIAALSLGIDKTEGFDNTKFRKYTDIQNQYILKYSYSKQLNKHVKARKFLLEGYGNNFILNTIEECVKSIEPT